MNQRNLADFIWSVADVLRGDFRQSEFGRIILPFTVLRRLECVLEPTRDKVRSQFLAMQASGVDMDLILPATAGATFYNVQAWQHLAEECAEHVRKGRVVTVVGDVRLRQYEGRDGTKGQSLDVRADEVALCLSKFPPRDGQARPASAPAQSWQAPAGDPWAVGGRDEAAPF